jgi:hypothetical protein
MGRMQILLDNDVERRFRQSFNGLKKGDLSKKVEFLILKSLGEEAKQVTKDVRVINTVLKDIDKMILDFYNCDEFSLLAANKVVFEWDKIKQRHGLK